MTAAIRAAIANPINSGLPISRGRETKPYFMPLRNLRRGVSAWWQQQHFSVLEAGGGSSDCGLRIADCGFKAAPSSARPFVGERGRSP